MNLLQPLKSTAILFAAALLLLAGHDLLTQRLFAAYAARGVAAAARLAAPTAALVVHALTGVFVLPLLARLRRAFPDPDVPRVVVMTAIAAIGLRTLWEAATGVLVLHLPVVAMAMLCAAVPLLAARRPDRCRRRLRATAAAPRRFDAAA